MSTNDEEKRCTLCDRRKDNHQSLMHPFSDPDNPLSSVHVFGKTPKGRVGGSSSPTPELDVTEVHSTTPFDPVLRLALMNKGILEPEDMTEAEEQLRIAQNIPLLRIAQNIPLQRRKDKGLP